MDLRDDIEREALTDPLPQRPNPPVASLTQVRFPDQGHNRVVPSRHLVREDVDFLSLLSAANRRRLLQGATQAVVPAGTIAYSPGAPDVAVVIEEGLVRVYWSVPDGRQATVAFVHKNEMIGTPFPVRHAMWFYVQIVSESTVKYVNLKTFRDLAAREVEVMAAIAAQQYARVRNEIGRAHV